LHRIVIRKAQEKRQHADLDIGEVAHPLAHHGHRVAREALPPLQHHEIERLLGAQVLPYVAFDGVAEIRVLEDRELHVEDRRFLGASPALRPGANAAQPVTGVQERLAEALQFVLDLLVGDDPVPHVRHLPLQEMGRADNDAWRCWYAAKSAVHQCSPNRLSMMVAISLSACSSSGPDARSRSVLPHSAASIMTPMMLLPFTSSPSLTIVMSDRKSVV